MRELRTAASRASENIPYVPAPLRSHSVAFPRVCHTMLRPIRETHDLGEGEPSHKHLMPSRVPGRFTSIMRSLTDWLRKQPVIALSVMFGTLGPVSFYFGRPLLKKLGYPYSEPLPQHYPYK